MLTYLVLHIFIMPTGEVLVDEEWPGNQDEKQGVPKL